MSNIQVFSYARSYSLYIYYWMTIKEAERNNRSPSRLFGFSCIAAFFIMGLVSLYFIVYNYFPEPMGDFYEGLSRVFGKADTHKGSINIGFFLLITSLAVFFCYLVCSYRISFNDIPKRLNGHSSLKEFAWWKLALPFFVPLILWLLDLLWG